MSAVALDCPGHAFRARRQHDLRAIRFEQIAALDRHRVGHDEDDGIAFRGGDECQRDAGVTAGRFENRHAWRQPAVALRGFDHRNADAILDRSGGIERLHLHQNGSGDSGVEPRNLHQRRVAEGVGEVFVDARHSTVVNLRPGGQRFTRARNVFRRLLAMRSRMLAPPRGNGETMERFLRLRRIAAACVLVAMAQWPAMAAAQTAHPSMDDALAAIRAYAPAAMEYQGTPGLSVAITDRSKTLAVLTLGYANADTRAPVTPATRFAIGSITKSMTALAMMQLVDAGKLSLDAADTALPAMVLDRRRLGRRRRRTLVAYRRDSRRFRIRVRLRVRRRRAARGEGALRTGNGVVVLQRWVRDGRRNSRACSTGGRGARPCKRAFSTASAWPTARRFLRPKRWRRRRSAINGATTTAPDRCIRRWSRRRCWISSIPPVRCYRRPRTWRVTCGSISTAVRPRAERR